MRHECDYSPDELYFRHLDTPWSPRKLQREWKRLRKMGWSWNHAEQYMRDRGLFPEPVKITVMVQLTCAEPGFNEKVKP